MFRLLIVRLLFAGLLAVSVSVGAFTVSGTVSAGDQPIPGALVTATAADGIAVSVYADAGGRFSIGGSASGPVELRARAPGFEDAKVSAADGGQVKIVVSPAADPMLLASSSQLLALLPEGEQKRRFIMDCTSCHEINHARVWKDGVIRDQTKWTEAITLMKAMDVYALISPQIDVTRYSTWLATYLSPERIATIHPGPKVDLAAIHAATITEFPVPVATELPHDLGIGPDGRIWVTGFWTSAMWAMDPKTGKIDTYAVAEKSDTPAQVRALAFDKKGMLWIVLGGSKSVVRLDPRTRKFRTYPVGMYAHDVVLDSRGNVWINDYFSKPERIAKLDPVSEKVTIYYLPSSNLSEAYGNPLPYGLMIDGEDRLWATTLAGNTLLRFDTRTTKSKLYKMPESLSGPRRHAIGNDGSVWIPEYNTGYLTRFDPKTETFERFNLGNSTLGPYDVIVDRRNGAVWITGSLDSSLVRFDAKTHAIERYPLPTEPAYARHMAIDAKSGAVWTAYSSLPTAVPKIVRLDRRD